MDNSAPITNDGVPKQVATSPAQIFKNLQTIVEVLTTKTETIRLNNPQEYAGIASLITQLHNKVNQLQGIKQSQVAQDNQSTAGEKQSEPSLLDLLKQDVMESKTKATSQPQTVPTGVTNSATPLPTTSPQQVSSTAAEKIPPVAAAPAPQPPQQSQPSAKGYERPPEELAEIERIQAELAALATKNGADAN